MSKKCSKCEIEKPLSDFYKNKVSKDGYRADCKKCMNIVRDAWADKNKDRLQELSKNYRKREDIKEKRNINQKDWRKNNLNWELWYKAKRRSIEQSLPFDIEPNDITIPTNCPILGIALFITENRIGDHSPTVDKIFPELGYVKTNIVVISAKANRIKNNGTVDDIKKVYNWYRKQKYDK